MIAAGFGLVHDQVTYGIAPECFTRFKSVQFHWLDLGLPPRLFAAEVAIVAAAPVGFAAAWFLARMALRRFPPGQARRVSLKGFAMVFGLALLGSITGYVLGLFFRGADLSSWQELSARYRIQDLPAFVRVAYIHNASYIGTFIGLLLALWRIRN